MKYYVGPTFLVCAHIKAGKFYALPSTSCWVLELLSQCVVQDVGGPPDNGPQLHS